MASGGASTGSTGGTGTYVQTVTPAGSGAGDPAGRQPPLPGTDDRRQEQATRLRVPIGPDGSTPASWTAGQARAVTRDGQSSQAANQGESSSNKKKKKNKKPSPAQAQPQATSAQAQPQPQVQPQSQAAPQSQPQ